MDKEDVAYVDDGMLFSHDKEGNSDICNSVDGCEGIMLSEKMHTEKDKYSISLAYRS